MPRHDQGCHICRCHWDRRAARVSFQNNRWGSRSFCWAQKFLHDASKSEEYINIHIWICICILYSMIYICAHNITRRYVMKNTILCIYTNLNMNDVYMNVWMWLFSRYTSLRLDMYLYEPFTLKRVTSGVFHSNECDDIWYHLRIGGGL